MKTLRSRWDQRGVPSPGSKEAETMGCICPYWENAHGRGVIINRELTFFLAVGCPMHLPVEDTAPL